MQSNAANVDDYLAEIPADRRVEISKVRQVILDNLDQGYEEGMQYGMIGYYVPHRVFPSGYHCDPRQPLPFAGLASQKNHLALYLNCVYEDRALAAWFKDAWLKSGKKLDMGKACLRFKKADDLALSIIAEVLRKLPAAKYIACYEASRQGTKEAPAAKTKPAISRSTRNVGSKSVASQKKGPKKHR